MHLNAAPSHPRGTAAALALWAARALVVLALLAPFWYWDGGLIEGEATLFVQQYHADRSVLRHVFDPYGNDLQTYQARELSYFFDYVDAHVFGALFARGYLILVPLSAVLSGGLTAIVFLRAARRQAHVPALTAWLLLLVYLSNYAYLVTMGMLYRSAKPLLPPLLIAATFYVRSRLRDARADASARTGWRAPAVVFVLFCLASLLDRQGFFLAAVGAGALALHAILTGGRRDLAGGAALAVAAMVLYNLALAPALVERLNGYRPGFEYQRLPLAAVMDPAAWKNGASLVLQGGALLAGGVPLWGFAALLALIVVVALASGWRPRRSDLPWMLVALSQPALFALMIARHPPVFDYADHRVWYYPMALQALLIAGALVLINRLIASAPASRARLVNATLAMAVVLNVLSWDDFFGVQMKSKWFPVLYEQNVALKASLGEGRPRWYLAGPYAAFFRFCSTLER